MASQIMAWCDTLAWQNFMKEHCEGGRRLDHYPVSQRCFIPNVEPRTSEAQDGSRSSTFARYDTTFVMPSDSRPSGDDGHGDAHGHGCRDYDSDDDHEGDREDDNDDSDDDREDD